MIRDTWRIVRLGLKSLMLHKLRSALTTAGILFGVASVIAMLAVGEGAKQDALERFQDMGVTNLIARSKKPAETATSNSQSLWSALSYGLLYAEADLIAALDAGRPARAALDVTREEPLPKESPIWHHPQITLTPHDSADTPGTALRADETFIENLRRYVKGEPMMNLVDPSAFRDA